MQTIRYALLLGGILIGCTALAASANAAQGWYHGGYGQSSGYGHSGGYGGGFGWNGYGFQPRYYGHSHGHHHHGNRHGGHHHGHRR